MNKYLVFLRNREGFYVIKADRYRIIDGVVSFYTQDKLVATVPSCDMVCDHDSFPTQSLKP